MQPTSPLGQLNQSMQAGTPALGQVTGGSPNFDPSLQPPVASPTPQGSPIDLIHKAAATRGIDLSNHPQLQPQVQAPQQGMATLPIQDENAQQPGVQVPISEAELIIKALSKRLAHHSDTTSKLLDSFLPPPPMAQGTPQ